MTSPYQHRKSSTRLRLTGPDGQPLAGREATVRMTSHEFLFGTAEFEVLPYCNGELSGAEKELLEARLALSFDLFNAITLPFYWGRFEPAEGAPDTQRMKQAAQWLKAKGKVLKGHPLCWHTVCAPWLLEKSNEEIMDIQLKRIARDTQEFAGLIDMWDVINEVVIMPRFDRYDNAITRLCKQVGRIPLVRSVFEAAKAAVPGAALLINDFDTSWSYDILLEGLLEAGVPIDAIGIQSHMHQGYWGVEKTQEILARFGQFGLPLHFTETSLVSGDIMPSEIEDLNDFKHNGWSTTPDGEARQALEVETHFRTLFADPNTVSATYWHIEDGHWLDAPSGLLRKDASAKPAYNVLYRLIKEEWWTPAATLCTDADGCVTVEGYRGDYAVEMGGSSAAFKLVKGRETTAVTL